MFHVGNEITHTNSRRSVEAGSARRREVTLYAFRHSRTFRTKNVLPSSHGPSSRALVTPYEMLLARDRRAMSREGDRSIDPLYYTGCAGDVCGLNYGRRFGEHCEYLRLRHKRQDLTIKRRRDEQLSCMTQPRSRLVATQSLLRILHEYNEISQMSIRGEVIPIPSNFVKEEAATPFGYGRVNPLYANCFSTAGNLSLELEDAEIPPGFETLSQWVSDTARVLTPYARYFREEAGGGVRDSN